MNRIELSKLMMIIEAEYGNRFETSPARLDVWHEVLGHFSFEDARKGTLAAIAHSTQWPPSVGDVRNHANVARKDRIRVEEQKRLDAKAAKKTNDPAEADRVHAVVRNYLNGMGVRR